MAVNPTYPGIYVQEIPSGVRSIAGVSTSVGLFIGRTKRGPLNDPVQCLSYSDFERAFSGDADMGDMPRAVKLFFLNGGTNCYVLRIANGANAASVTLQSEAGVSVLDLTAKQAGASGETIRATVAYKGQQPEATFNITLFRVETNAAGVQEAVDSETWQNLSMNSNSPLYAPTFISQNSQLVDAAAAGGIPAAVDGFSQSGLPVGYETGTDTTFRDAWAALIGTVGSANQFQLSVDGNRYLNIDLSGINVGALAGPLISDFETQLATEIEGVISQAFDTANLPGITAPVSFATGPTPGVSEAPNDATALLCLTSTAQGDIYIRSGPNNDAAAPLRLGTGQGGLEVSAHAARRPAPTGMSLQASDRGVLRQLASLTQAAVDQITLPALDTIGNPVTVNIALGLATTAAADSLYYPDGLNAKLQIIRDAINTYQLANRRTFFWRAEQSGARLSLIPTSGAANDIGTLVTAPTDIPTTIPNSFLRNVRRYSVGTAGTVGTQTPGTLGTDGSAPLASDYDDAYEIARSEIDLFNLLLLPEDAEPAAVMADLYGPASVFCQEERAFLLMDPPAAWTDSQTAADGADGMRVGVVTDHSAIFYPRITINEDGLRKNVGPAGAIAGLMARIDSSRGVWKAPAGTEASLRRVVGLQYRFSDRENGVLNPRAVNTIRIFPNGIVNWGARTLDGDNDFGSEYKYIPIRRLALFIEESLYRGLKWVVFEPNDEPLWAQIRLNVGAFMHDLFRQGAFQGQTPKDAYFGDYSENTGFPSPGMYRDSRGLTCEQGGPPDVRSRRVSPRPE